uniref:Target of rapamycin complex subunit lst8 n=1 Tax=Ditylenchus dipsaci TaxID=166011 RepID=A0A915CWG0_9BILA
MVDQPILISAAMDGTIRFWDTATQKNTLSLQYKESQINNLCITPDGTQLAVGAWQNLRMYSLKEPTANGLHTFSVHDQKNVTAVGFQADGKWMYTGGEDGMAKIWDMRVSTSSTQLNCQRIFQVNTPIHSVALHPNQVELIVADSAGALYVWDLRTDRDDSLVTEVDLAEHILHVDIDNHAGMMPHTHGGTLSMPMGLADDKENLAISNTLLPPIAPAPPPAPELPGMVLAMPRGVEPGHLESQVTGPPGYLGGGYYGPGSLISGQVQTGRPGCGHNFGRRNLQNVEYHQPQVAEHLFRAQEQVGVGLCFHQRLQLHDHCHLGWPHANVDLKNNEVVRTYQGHSLGITAMAFRDCA